VPYVDSLPAKRLIFDFWKNRLSNAGLFIDWGEPSCWACGFHYGAKYDISSPHASIEEIYRCWDKIPLQRCHIVPRSLGGSNEPSNLFLMCRECHDLAPNTDIPEIFFEWAKGQSYLRREDAKYRATLASFGIEGPDQETIADIIMSSDFKEWISNRVGLHRPQ
jgi:hypothetical protein